MKVERDEQGRFLGDVSRPLAERFWEKVDRRGKHDCWVWSGARDRGGYGLIWAGSSQLAHRVSWVLHHGPIPRGKKILHRCDNPPCVNPDHLECGTQKKNMRDAMERGRWNPSDTARMARGERSGGAKLTRRQVLDIRREYASGKASMKQLAKKHGVVPGTISKIVNRQRWGWLKED